MMQEDNFQNPILLNPARPLPSVVGIVGAGTIGPDIGYYLKSEVCDLKLVLLDINQAALDKAVERFHSYVKKGLDRGKLTGAQAESVTRNLVTTLCYKDLSACDWVIEAATEHIDLKREIFDRIESVVREDALITSNTSSLPAERLFSHLAHPGRTTVTHFFAPAFRNPAVEVIDWHGASSQTVDYLRWFFYVTGKVPIVTRDVVCFMLDRVFDNWCNEAALLLNGITPAQVDTVAGRYVHAGPFFVLNLAHGNPIIFETNELQADVEGEHYRPAKIFKIAETWETVKPGDRVDVDEDTTQRISDRLLGVLFSQSVDILDHDIGQAAELDTGSRLAFAFKKGPLDLMRELGDTDVKRILDRLQVDRPGMPMPGRPISEYYKFCRFTLVDDVAGVKIITLYRPDALNALHDQMTDEVLSIIRAHEDDPDTVGFVITGYGTRAFCAGADIGRFASLLGKTEEASDYARHCSRLLVHLDRCPKPVVAAINGMALGGGLELAIRCSDLVATRDAVFQFPEITLGIVPGIGGMVVPYRRWPHAAETFHTMLTRAESLSALRAEEIGLVHALVGDVTELIAKAVNRVHEIAGCENRVLEHPVFIAPVDALDASSANGPVLSCEVLKIMAQAIEEAAKSPSLDEALEVGYRSFGVSAATAAAREGIVAFGEGRKPDFSLSG